MLIIKGFSSCFVVRPGLEPRLIEPKSTVLPLHHRTVPKRVQNYKKYFCLQILRPKKVQEFLKNLKTIGYQSFIIQALLSFPDTGSTAAFALHLGIAAIPNIGSSRS